MLICHCTLPSINPNACKTCPSWIAKYGHYQDTNLKWTQPSLFPEKEKPVEPKPTDYFVKKQDADKLPWNLLDLDAIEGIVEVLAFGARKYAPNSWQTVPDGIPRYTAALMRHMVAIQRGEYLDPESGLPHIYHVGCNAMFLIHFYKVAHEDAF